MTDQPPGGIDRIDADVVGTVRLSHPSDPVDVNRSPFTGPAKTTAGSESPSPGDAAGKPVIVQVHFRAAYGNY